MPTSFPISPSAAWRPAAIGAVFGHNIQNIQQILDEVIEAEDSAFPGLAFDAYEAMTKFHGIGQGIATRLLSLARPDRPESVDAESRGGLVQYVGLAS